MGGEADFTRREVERLENGPGQNERAVEMESVLYFIASGRSCPKFAVVGVLYHHACTLHREFNKY